MADAGFILFTAQNTTENESFLGTSLRDRRLTTDQRACQCQDLQPNLMGRHAKGLVELSGGGVCPTTVRVRLSAVRRTITTIRKASQLAGWMSLGGS